ncbi:MAG: FAD-dependent monooxygenase [Actinobacteria bacterium]|nr:FAD-dependent monooxygenase [Actinomycetota bacterium]
MARIVVIGAGVAGLSVSMLLARDGHDVLVVERDSASPPASADEAWDMWERRGVNQFRLLHYFLPRFRILLEAELPEVVSAATDLGALRYNPIALAPAEITGGPQPGDDDFESVTARRPVMEAALRRAADSMSRVTIRRGTGAAGLETGAETTGGVPHVTGVRTETGETIAADLVIDAAGRRSALPAWLAAIGARPIVEEREDSGFVYYGRHFRSGDGSVPVAFGPPLQHYDSISTLTLPADNGTWGVGFVTGAGDPDLRALRDPQVWATALHQFPLVAHWADGKALDDQVAVTAKIEDRHRDLHVDGMPVATGVLAVADSWACTNPSVGRGASIGLLHAVALRDVLRASPVDQPLELAHAWNEATLETVEPWYRDTLGFDRNRLAEIDAQRRGEPYDGGPEWELVQAMQFASAQDPRCSGPPCESQACSDGRATCSPNPASSNV